jgi:ribosomal protein S18 acetylase RimI-like enzyme
MIIQKAKISDLENIMLMYKSCVEGMLANNIDQWDESYPNKDIITQDLIAQTYFIMIKNNIIIAGINIDQNQDKTYLSLQWNDKKNQFLVVHRLAVKEDFWSNGIGKSLMLFTENLVIEKGLKSIRLDTYSGNPKAMDFYIRMGYNKVGTISLKPNKNKYHCFEKTIK